MDVSKIYVAMCDREEIQSQVPDFEDGLNNNNSAWIEKSYHCETYQVWLPRQDQIQEMLGISGHPLNLMDAFYDWSDPSDPPEDKGIRNIETFEQLWLAFYMHEKHGLAWSGESWKEER